MKLAFYGRFSSDNQRESSIEDQLRTVQRWAERHGHRIIANFSDMATSGASLKLLAGRRCLDGSGNLKEGMAVRLARFS